MSRSYRKFPMRKPFDSGKFGKKCANRKIRKLPLDYNIPNGRSFKKLYESAEIFDYRMVEFKEDVIKDWYKDQLDIANGINLYKIKYQTTLEEDINSWKKFYICK